MGMREEKLFRTLKTTQILLLERLFHLLPPQ